MGAVPRPTRPTQGALVRPIARPAPVAEDDAKAVAGEEVRASRVVLAFRLLLLVVLAGREAREADPQGASPGAALPAARHVRTRVAPVQVPVARTAPAAAPTGAARVADGVAIGRVVALAYQTGHGAGPSAGMVGDVGPQVRRRKEAAHDLPASQGAAVRRVDAMAHP